LFRKLKFSPNTVAQRLAALRFFYVKTLKKTWSIYFDFGASQLDLTCGFLFLPFSALNFAHRSFVALDILALAAADSTRFFLPIGLALLVIPPLKTFIAARTVSNCCCTLPNCCCNFASSCFNAAIMSIKSSRRRNLPWEISKRQLNSLGHSFQ